MRKREPPPAPPKERALSLKDVARRAGVHSSTVSRALDPEKMSLVQPETRARVQALAEELRYTPHAVARGLRRGHTLTIGVVVADIGNPFLTAVVRGVAGVIDARGYIPLIAETRDEPERHERLLANLRGRRVDAVITTAARRGDARLLREFAADGIPLVLAVRSLDERSLPAVTHDDVAGGALAARHLASLGHRVVAQLLAPGDISSFRGRRRGFARAAKAAGLQVVDLGEEAKAPTIEEGRRLMELLLTRRERPTAVFAQNDSMAIGAIDVLHAAGLRCPDDMSVLGYNDAPLSDHLRPALSTIRFPGEEIGRAAAQMALARIDDGDSPPSSVSFPPELVVRESTAPPPRPVRARRRK
jgi:LacI family transcriptional regulator